MSIHRKIQTQIARKSKEISELEKKLQDVQLELGRAMAHKEGLEQALSLLPKDETKASDSQDKLRFGSQLFRVRKILKERGSPMHINEICAALGKEPTKATKQSITGSLGRLVREGRFFTRTGSGTFGLVEWTTQESDASDEDRGQPTDPFRHDDPRGDLSDLKLHS